MCIEYDFNLPKYSDLGQLHIWGFVDFTFNIPVYFPERDSDFNQGPRIRA